MLRSLLRDARDSTLRLVLSSTARSVLDDELTYLSPRKLHNLEQCIRTVDGEGVPGDFIECGVALGGSAIVLASRLAGQRRFRGYDVFATIPPPSDRDDEHAHRRYEVIRAGQSRGIGDRPYYGYIDNLFDVVCENFNRYGLPPDGRKIALCQGLFEDTLPAEDGPIAVAHIDCDWHDPVFFCLQAIHERLSPGGFIVLDDYNDYGGCRRATDAFVAATPDVRLQSTRGSAVLRRV